MHIPFIDSTGHGVHITSEFIHWFVLHKMRGRITASKAFTRSVSGESVSGESVPSILQEMADEMKPAGGVVASHLASQHVRLIEAELPYSDPSVAFDSHAWVQEQAQSALPEGTPLSAFAVRARRLKSFQRSLSPVEAPVASDTTPATARAGQRVLIAMAPLKAIEARIRLFEAAGLTLSVLGDVRAHLHFAYAHSDAFTTGPGVLVHFEDETGWVVQSCNGQPVDLPRRLDIQRQGERVIVDPLQSTSGASSAAGLRSVFAALRNEELTPGASGQRASYVTYETRALTELPPAATEANLPLFVAGNVEWVAQQGDQEKGGKTFSGRPEASDGRRAASCIEPCHAPIEPCHAPALALATADLYREAEAIDFLTQAARRSARDKVDRVEAKQVFIHASLGTALLVVLALIVSGLAEWVIARERMHIGLSDERFRVLESTEQEHDEIAQRLERSQALVRGQSRVAPLLEHVGRAVPQEAWLRTFVIEEKTSEKPASVTLDGFVVREGELTTLLSNLERQSGFGRVALTYVEKLTPDQARRATGMAFRQSVSAFGVLLEQASTGLDKGQETAAQGKGQETAAQQRDEA